MMNTFKKLLWHCEANGNRVRAHISFINCRNHIYWILTRFSSDKDDYEYDTPNIVIQMLEIDLRNYKCWTCSSEHHFHIHRTQDTDYSVRNRFFILIFYFLALLLPDDYVFRFPCSCVVSPPPPSLIKLPLSYPNNYLPNISFAKA